MICLSVDRIVDDVRYRSLKAVTDRPQRNVEFAEVRRETFFDAQLDAPFLQTQYSNYVMYGGVGNIVNFDLVHA